MDKGVSLELELRWRPRAQGRVLGEGLTSHRAPLYPWGPQLPSASPLGSSPTVFCFPVLLLAYMKGNANLCRAIVRSGARLGVNNNQGVNIFNYQVATKQLLFRLLGEWPTSCPWPASTVQC